LICAHPSCTGVHDNNRYRDLCPRSLDGKRYRDARYYASTKGALNRIRKTYWDRPTMAAEMEALITSGRCEELAREAMASDDPTGYIVRATFAEVFGADGLTFLGQR
jgi:hypothetical protein